MDKVAKVLETISVGQYSPQLYFKGKQQHSSVFGGLFTIAYSIFFLTVSTFILVDLFSLKNFSLQTETFNFDNTFRCNSRLYCKSITFDEFYEAYFNLFSLIIQIPDFDPRLEDCNKFNMTATLKFRMVSTQKEDTYDINITKGFKSSIDDEACIFDFPNSIEIKNKFRDQSDEIFFDNYYQGIQLFPVGQWIIVNGLNETFQVKIGYFKQKYFDSGVSSFSSTYQPVIQTTRVIYRTFSYVEYCNYKSISSIFYRNIPDERTIYFDTEQFESYEPLNVNRTQLKIYTEALRKGVNYTRYPQSFLTALAKISGLLVILKASLAMMAYHRNKFFKQMEQADEKEQKIPHQQQSPINESLASLLFEGRRAENKTIMSIEERFSFERIEDTVEKVQDFQAQIKSVSQALQTHQHSTKKSIVSQSAQIESILQKQLPEQIVNIEQTVQNLQQALSISQRQQTLHEKQILELQEVIRVMQIKQQAVEVPSKENE
ncbi:hypothetical protein FGO68_gene5750 [Halteria grandinella]|uniref:Transmembrane protein n=1 Tax=Halteria grandinella TaxID=5974 RepID=A0A8J8T2I4_HALGN|nr:hypothetical protein FGO68_gene5750 [Halteria grandinella]